MIALLIPALESLQTLEGSSGRVEAISRLKIKEEEEFKRAQLMDCQFML